ncbi:MAG: 5,6-dimethylbenzimidazole synthase [Emcibacter sp.]|nr:5,6-dimethylbenzimidazole synthase [Emcibacter sp.]MBL4893355.1 5,6-dimethylbenzimidazole synthase [Emcibacter sp.]
MISPIFNDNFRKKFHELLTWRRDVRRFRTDPVDETILDDCLQMACQGPSVGNSQPWRFVRIQNSERRDKLTDYFKAENKKALSDFDGEEAALYARLKLSGLQEAPVQISVFADINTDIGKGLGSKTMPETKIYSVIAAIQILWLALRSHDIGLGWVSILPPEKMAGLLDVDTNWVFVGHLCIGHPEEQADTPELVKEGWQERLPMDRFLLQR